MWRATYLAANSSSVSPEVFLSFSHFAATSLSLLPILADATPAAAVASWPACEVLHRRASPAGMG